ncbi:MAG: flavodoxin-dependent (E)-4-hydroxy-3-methylbut-2-enyl-diphosphate synthase [Oscillospiraceae bacterium]|nr:flavodoxin-dependent (E)-4-hydroxy-3-methylbut-2-enyl-diphosphate synthase [Oscillospiraceae bacterium]
MKREETRKILVGNVQVGGNDKVVIQSMTNTLTKDIDKTVKQILDLEAVGCEIARVACLDVEDARAIEEIKKRVQIPIVADIHFDYKIALEALDSGADQIRINPGNIGSAERVRAVVDKCRTNNISIRIGVNGGSLPKDMIEKHEGRVADAMVESAKRHVEILEALEFYDIEISLKASNVDLCIEANEKAAEIFNYPLHLGVTHSGTEFGGTIASSIGLGILLRQGIGSTMRVSLSSEPVKEIKVAKEILKNCSLYKGVPTLIACPTCGRIQYDLIPIANEIEDFLSTIKGDITVAIMGCAVNGPEEAKHADIGIAGGKGEGLLFKKGEIVQKVREEKMVEVLKEEILKLINE